jgi:SAM-dependent methyltransferase
MVEKVNFDEYTGNYNELLRESTKFFSASEAYFAKYKVDLVRSLTNFSPKRILEYGCGIGRNIRYLRESFPQAEIIGTDVSEQSLSIAAEENPFACFEVERGNLELGSFDLIFVAGVFHHIPVADRQFASSTLANRLSKRGRIHVFEHNPFNPVTRRIVNTCPYDADAVLLRPAELCLLLENAGLKVSSKAFCLFIPPVLSNLAGLEKYLGWLPFGGQYRVTAGYL